MPTCRKRFREKYSTLWPILRRFAALLQGGDNQRHCRNDNPAKRYLRMTRVATALPAIPAINFPYGNAPEVSTLSDFVVRFAMSISSMRSRASAFRVEYDRHSMPMPMSLNGLITRKVHDDALTHPRNPVRSLRHRLNGEVSNPVLRRILTASFSSYRAIAHSRLYSPVPSFFVLKVRMAEQYEKPRYRFHDAALSHRIEPLA